MKRLFVGTVPPKKGKRLMVGTVSSKNSEDVIGRYSPTKKIVKRLFVGTVPPKQ